jgi:uncharacterized membrane protein SpoIIM required for sporulation
MVLESLIGERNIRKNPILILIITFVVSVGSIIAASIIFPSHASVLSVAFITIGLVPLVHNILAKEEYEEALQRKSSTTFFARHFNLIMIYVWIFVGIILAFSVMYIAAPQESRADMFQEQLNAFCVIAGDDACSGGLPQSISGKATSIAFNECANPATKNVLSCSFYIFENNFRVLLAVLFFSLLYGAGAIFIIAWNASIIGMFFGEMILVGAHVKWIGLLQGMLIGHGPPELLSYVFGALAGAILSAMISRGQFLRHEFSTIIKDVAFLALLAFFSVIYGAIVEGVGILGHGDLYFVLGFVYVLAIILVVFFYGKRRFR